MNTTPNDEQEAAAPTSGNTTNAQCSGCGSSTSSEQNSNASFEYRASETDIVQSGGSNQSIYSAHEVVIDSSSSSSGSSNNVEDDQLVRNERSQSMTTPEVPPAPITQTEHTTVRERSSSFCDNIRNKTSMKRSNHSAGNSTGDIDRLSKLNNNVSTNGTAVSSNPSTSSLNTLCNHEEGIFNKKKYICRTSLIIFIYLFKMTIIPKIFAGIRNLYANMFSNSNKTN